MLVNFSSVAGLIGHAGTGVYNASKFAVEGLSESLAQELEAFGVKVMLVNPDAFKSEFFADRADNLRLDEASVYSGKPGGTIGRSEEHTSELQSLMRISYAVFCLQKQTSRLNII